MIELQTVWQILKERLFNLEQKSFLIGIVYIVIYVIGCMNLTRKNCMIKWFKNIKEERLIKKDICPNCNSKLMKWNDFLNYSNHKWKCPKCNKIWSSTCTMM